MTAAQYRAAIKKLGLSQRAAAKFFGVNERTSRRWAKSGPPNYVQIILLGPPKGMVRLFKPWNKKEWIDIPKR